MKGEERKLKCLVVDDEPEAIVVLKTYIQNVSSLQLAGECTNALTAFDFCNMHAVDIIFLDIQMPQLTGIELVKSLPHPPKVIFTTAYREFAVEGFELGAADYLLKPVSMDRFLKAIYRITHNGIPLTDQNMVTHAERFLYFRADRKMVKVFLNEILFIESLKDYIKIFTTKGHIITKQSISAVQEMLPEDKFIRIHRSFIVSIRKIESYTSSEVTVNNHEIPIGPLYRHDLFKKIPGNFTVQR